MGGLMQGKTVLVMGVANRWSLAYAIAQSLSREGARLLLTYQSERQRSATEELAAGLGGARTAPCDVSQDDDLDRFFASLQGPEGELDAVVHSIAFADRADLDRPFCQTPRPGFALALDVSAYSFVAVARRAADHMPRGGSILTLTYLGSTRVMPNYNVMGVAKAALEAEVRYLASELGARAIRVNAVSAGPVKTVSARGVKDLGRMLSHVAEHSPLRRGTAPEEVGDAALFLASDLARGVTGNILFVDSGYHVMGL
ncbi:MAG: enoyl-ACP reductase FabI [Terriglobales bacterium]